MISRAHPLLLLLLVTPALSACGTGASRVVVNVPDAPKITDDQVMAQEVGRLLSPDQRVSADAERRLLAQTDDGRDTLLAYAETIPLERDPRWLHVLDEHHAMPTLGPDEEITFLLWKAGKGDRFHVMKVQSRLLDMAQSDPAPLIARMQRNEDGTSMLVMALALAEEKRAIPTLLERYLAPSDVQSQRATVEALALIAGEARRPRERGTPDEMRRDAGRIRRWYRHQLEIAAASAEDAATQPEAGDG